MNKLMSQTALFTFFVFALLLTGCTKESFAPQDDDGGGVLVNPGAAPSYLVETAVPEDQSGSLIAGMARKGYRPVWIDGFIHRAGNSTQTYDVTLFNLVFEKSQNAPQWQAFTGLTGSSYQAKFDDLTGQGYRLVHIESYADGGKLKYAPIFAKQNGPAFAAVHGLTAASYQDYFDQKIAGGYRLVNRSIVLLNGKQYVAALFDKKDVGAWVAKSGLSGPEVQAMMVESKSNGKMAAYLDIAQQTSTKFTYGPIFNSEDNNGWYALNGLDEGKLSNELQSAKDSGYRPTFVVAYDEPGLINGNEVYHIRYAVGFRK